MLAFLCSLIASVQSQTSTNAAIRQDGFYFTNPLLDCEPKLTYVAPFKEEISQFITSQLEQKKALRVSVHFKQLNTGYSFGINNDKYSPASMLKVADAIYVLKQAEKNPELLNELVEFKTLTPGDNPPTKLEVGKSYSIRELIYHMIVYSDNEAKTLLQLHLKNGVMWKDLFEDIGINIKTGAAHMNLLSARSYSRLLSILYNSTYLDKENSEAILKTLTKTRFVDGIVYGINNPKLQVANKFGFRRLKDRVQLHESAIVYLPGNPYLLTIMTEGTEEQNLYELLHEIVRIVHRNCNEQLDVKSSVSKAESLINPLIDCDSELEMLLPFKSTVESLITQLKSENSVKDVSVYFKHFPSGQGFTINEDLKFSPASTFKVPHLMAVLRESQSDTSLLEQVLHYNKELLTRGQNIRFESIQPNQDYTVGELLARMIIDSDNLAATLVTDNTPQIERIWTNLFQDLKLEHIMEGSDHMSKDHKVSVNELALFFRVLYNSTYLNRENSDYALNLLASTKFGNGIRQGIPDKNVVVASKFGERSSKPKDGNPGIKQLHDIGIVYYEDNPYLLGIMTLGSDFEELNEVIAQISATVYREISSQIPQEAE